MLAEVDAKSLVFGTDEDGGNHVTAPVKSVSIWKQPRELDDNLHENSEHAVVHSWVMPGIEDSQEDQPDGANDREGNGEAAENLLRDVIVVSEAASVSQPSFGNERNVEGDDHNGRGGDENWFPITRCTDV